MSSGDRYKVFPYRGAVLIALVFALAFGVARPAQCQELTVSAPASASLGVVEAGTIISGALGAVTVTDDRALLSASWTLSASSTDADAGGGATISNAAATISSGSIITTGTITVTGNSVDLSAPGTLLTATNGVGDNTATINPTLQIAVPADAPAGTYTLTLTFALDSGGTSATTIVKFFVTTSADLAITKSGAASVLAGDNLSYTVAVANNGPSDAQSVSWTDTLPAGTSFVSITQNTGTAFNCSGTSTVSCTIATLANGASASFTVVVHVGSNVADGTTLNNTATVTSATSDPSTGNNTSATTATLVSASADLAIVKTASANAIAGNDLNYDITVSNNGPSDAQSVSWTDTLPAGTSFVSITQNTGSAFNCSGTSTVTCTIATLGNGASASFTVVVHVGSSVADGTTLSNTATVTSATSDPTSGNDTSTATATLVSASADLAIVKTAPANAIAGNDLNYDITVTNNGPSDAKSVTWTDTLPAGTTFVSLSQGTGPSFNCTTGSTVSCTIATLPASGSASFSLVVLVDVAAAGGSTISNTASVTSATSDSTTGNNSMMANSSVLSGPVDVSISNTAPVGVAGGKIVYILTVHNAGPAPATNVVVTDPLPSGSSLSSATLSQGSCSGSTTITCALGTINSGGQATITLTVLLTGTVNTVTNTASVTQDNPDTNLANNSSTAVVSTVLQMAPALSESMLAMLALLLALGGLASGVRKKR